MEEDAKLSVPIARKCAHFSKPYLPSPDLQRKLSDRASRRRGGALSSPTAARASRSEMDASEEDHRNRNAASLSTSSGSIRKITISELPRDRTLRLGVQPNSGGMLKSENINNNNSNNNSIPSTLLSRVIGVSCENKPDSHFKIPVPRALSPSREPTKGATPPPNACCYTQRNATFNRELQQAEQWMKEKLQDLRDMQWRPLEEGLSQTIQRELRDFENTLIRLNQMGEQLVCKPSPAADQVRTQLSQLQDQWRALKQAAADQPKTPCGTRNLQEFHRKVDRLEAWIKEKEEEQWLAKLQEENIDRMQLTRRILDLKEDEELYRCLHDEINHLALNLEKQGKMEGKSISARRKHVNKMWLKVQSVLKDYHENLQLAMEVSSFYQQADDIVRAIGDKRQSACVRNEQEDTAYKEIRDIASQVMMLEVTVSQLSKLHPALAERVTQKQREVKERWTLLQKAVRNENSAVPASTSDPPTPFEEQQCGTGVEIQRMMGKEIKEERNRLKGHASVGNPGRNRKSVNSQEEGLPSKSHAHAVTGNSITHKDDVTGGNQLGTERNISPSELHVRLQKFTVSADKTLSWLKCNVAMATHPCRMATPRGLEASRRRQAALEREIRSNGSRIRAVKEEGWSLVRAGHPGSSKIEEFLGRLDGLWEELKARHGRNLQVLQESEALSVEAEHVLAQLDALERWLQTAEASLQRRGSAQGPDAIVAAEQESGLLEREVSRRGTQLQSLRRDADRLHGREHVHARRLPLRLREVEEMYCRVQSALTQQSSELEDTRMLTEFLECVEREESQEQWERRYRDLAQTVPGETGSKASGLGLRGDGGVASEPPTERVGDPVEELREAVEMLNDAARERGRSLCLERSLHELLSRHSSLTAWITQRLSLTARLGTDILGAESADAAGRCGLEALEERQEELETGLAVMEEEVQETVRLQAQLEEQCPERVAVDLQATLRAWDELRSRVGENRARLQRHQQLRLFFHNYRAMISWTEDTRALIFSENALHDGTDSDQLDASEMDAKIEQKFRDLEDLTVAGRSLMKSGHQLTNLIQERMEELRSILGWIRVHWRSQKHQMKNGRRGKAEPKGDNIYSETTISPVIQLELQGLAGTPANQQPASPSRRDKLPPGEDGYEVMSRVGMPTRLAPPLSLTQEPTGPSLNFAKPGDCLQAEMPRVVTRATECVRRPAESHSSARKDFWSRWRGVLENTFGTLTRKRKSFRQSADEVSTNLYAKDCTTAPPAGGHLALLRPSCRAQMPASSLSSSSSCLPPRANCAFNGLKLRSEERKRERETDVRRRTVQRIMGTEQLEEGTCTWPLKDRKRKEASNAERTGYLKNPLAREIDAECASQLDFTASHSGPSGNHGYRSLGSTLTSDLQKDLALVPDVIAIRPAEPNRTGPGRHAPLGTFKLMRSRTSVSRPRTQRETDLQKDHRRSRDTLATTDLSEQRWSMGTLTADLSEQRWSMGKLTADLSEQRWSMGTLTADLSEQRWNASTETDGLSEQKQTVLSNDLSEQTQTPSSDGQSECRQTTCSDALMDLPLVASSGISSLHEEVAQEWDKMAAALEVCWQAPKSRDQLRPGNYDVPTPPIVPSDALYDPCPCSPKPPRALPLRGMARSVTSLEEPSGRENSRVLMTEIVPPERQQFEEEEEELESIWSQTSICSDVMYQLACMPPSHSQEPHLWDPGPPHRKLITTSAPGLLTVELPHPSPCQNYPAKPDRKSWAGFPSGAPASGKMSMENKTVLDHVKLPDLQDQEKYIYQYSEEEEEDEEEEEAELGAGLGAEPGASTGCAKVQSMSLLSVHMGAVPDASERGQQGPSPRATWLEYQGTLERKHRLQPGGKKAPCRAWSTSHAVLYRQTLSFYQDRKNTVKNSDSVLHLNITGAECSPALLYTKKSHCFSLRLCDGSEYLLSASSHFLMTKWLLKIRANTVLSESDPSRSFSKPGSWENLRSTRTSHTGTAKDKEIAVLARTDVRNSQWHHGKLDYISPCLSLDGGSSDDYSSLQRVVKQRLSRRSKFGEEPSVIDRLERPRGKRRSQSFTAATLQKITPEAHWGGSIYTFAPLVGDETTPAS